MVVEAVEVASVLLLVGEAKTGRLGLSVLEAEDTDSDAEFVAEAEAEADELSGRAVVVVTVGFSLSGWIKLVHLFG